MLGIFFKDYFPDPQYRVVLGIIISLFGVYRIVIYRMKTKKYNFNFNTEENEDEQN